MLVRPVRGFRASAQHARGGPGVRSPPAFARRAVRPRGMEGPAVEGREREAEAGAAATAPLPSTPPPAEGTLPGAEDRSRSARRAQPFFCVEAPASIERETGCDGNCPWLGR